MALDGVALARQLLRAPEAQDEREAVGERGLLPGLGQEGAQRGKEVALGCLGPGGYLLHLVEVTGREAVDADGLAIGDAVDAAVLELELVARGGAVGVEDAGVVAFLVVRQLKAEGERGIRRGETLVCRDLLGDLEARHAGVGVLNAGRLGEELVDLQVAEVVAVGHLGRVLLEPHAVDARVGIDDGQAVGVVVGDVLQDGLAIDERATIPHAQPTVGELAVRGDALGGGGIAAPHKVTVAIDGGGLERALDVGEGVVQARRAAELREQAQQRAGAGHAAHAVTRLARVHVDTGVIHIDLGDGLVSGVAVGGLGLAQVVDALHQRLVLVGALREAHGALEVVVDGLVLGGGGVVGLGARIDGVGAVLADRDVLGLVELKLRAGHGRTGLVDLLHPQAVLHVGQVQARRELAAEVGALDAGGVFHRGLAERACRGVVDGHNVLGLAGSSIFLRHHEGVRGDVSRQVAERRLVEAGCAGGEDRGVAVLLRVVGRLDGTGHRVRAAEGVAIEVVALDGKPVGLVVDLVCRTDVGVAEHDGKRQARAEGVALVVLDGGQVRLCRNGLRRGDIAAVDPLAVDGDAVAVHVLDGVALVVCALVRRDERAARNARVRPRVLCLDVVQVELLVSRRDARAVARGRGDLLEDVVLAAVLDLLVIE